eukprot:TRINITY_DN5022_c0_g1_i1.p3 TRINITY_DN5022_c0_g1~~TRINITY_DN5022_c0_g1_i1.p3  ORF type:complete len:145 (-),score=20.87 TRINITY_DN5022_c0_g1_i1:15-449(-)
MVVLIGTITPEADRVLQPAYRRVAIAIPFLCGLNVDIFEKDIESLQNKKQSIIIKLIVITNKGTIKEFTSIKPLVPRSKKNIAIQIIINEPVSYTHLTLPTKRIVQISVGAVSLKKKEKNKINEDEIVINTIVREVKVSIPGDD